MATRIITEDEFYDIYRYRLDTYTSALYYDSTSRGHELYQEYYSATHELQRYLVHRHISQGFTEAMAYDMYDLLTGGALKPPRGYEYIKAESYPELARLHTAAEQAREKYNTFTWNRLVDYIDRIYELKKRLEINAVKPEHLEDVKKFVSMEERLRYIKENYCWGYGENTRKYDEEERRKKEKYDEDFAKAHPGFSRDMDEAEHIGHYAWQRGNAIREVKEKYGYKEYEDEETVVRRASQIYYKVMKDVELRVYERQKSIGNLVNYSRGVVRALKYSYPKYTDEKGVDFYKRHFGIDLVLKEDKKEQTVVASPTKPYVPKKTVKPSAPKPVEKPKPAIPTPDEIKKYCRISSKGKLFEYFGEAEHVSLPSGISEINKTAFDGVKQNLRVVVLPEGVWWLHDDTFSSCPKLEKVVLPQSLTGIGEKAFANCPKLKNISIPSGILNIAEGAFEGCVSLKSVVIPEDCLCFDSSFPKTCEVKRASAPSASQPASASSAAPTPKREAEIQSDVATYCRIDGDSLMRFSGDMDYVVLPDGIKQICGFAFNDVKKSLRVIVIPEGVTEIAEKTFKECANLEEIRLPSSLKKIGPWAFGYCKNLKSIDLPRGVINIGANAFEGCDSLTEVSVPSACYYNKNRRMASFPQNCKVNIV